MKQKRILALFAALLLVLLYAASIVFALIGSPFTQSLLMASLFCTIVIPAVLYGYLVVIRAMQHKNEEDTKPVSDHTSDSAHSSNTRNKKEK
ncbi:MAG: hypothetical protein SPF91_05145 [Clostridium sp.]|nr:hypothetical protein [Clostridiaceae bacterium]MDD6072981.1 hypothetical protein [Clostridium sp.]MDY5483566.1 hypothetical protein [Clostridium sp.]